MDLFLGSIPGLETDEYEHTNMCKNRSLVLKSL